MRIKEFRSVVVLLLAGIWAIPLYADSYYPFRPEDPRAAYLTKGQFEVHADGVGDDADALQQAINRVQETTRIGVVFIPEGRYRLGKTVFVWQGIRLIGYGQKRPVFVLGKDTPGFQKGGGKYMIHFADSRPRSPDPSAMVLSSHFTAGSATSILSCRKGIRQQLPYAFMLHSTAISSIWTFTSDLHLRRWRTSEIRPATSVCTVANTGSSRKGLRLSGSSY